MSASTLTRDRQTSFQLKTSFLPCTTLQLLRYDLDMLEKQIKASIAKAPMFFAGSPVVIDLEKMLPGPLNFSKIKELLIANALVPIGVRSGSEEQVAEARSAGLPQMNLGKTTFEEAEVLKKTEAPAQPISKLINSPIRSGMQIFAKESDLIVVAQVSPGAELLASGNIHVYGTLRGRALAGVHGNTAAQIFCQSLDAELVSIAGYYLTTDEIPRIEGAVQIYLEDEKVKIRGIST